MNRAHLKMLNFFMRSYQWQYGWIFVLIVGTSVLESVNLVAFFPVFSSLLGTPEAGAPLGRVFGSLVSIINRLPLQDHIVSSALLLFCVMVCKAVLVVLRERLIASTSGTVMYEVKNRLMARYTQAPYEFLLATKQGGLLHATLLAPQRLGTLLLRVPQVIAEFLKMLAIAAVLVLAWPLAAMILGVIGLGYNALTHALGRRISYNIGTGRVKAWTGQASVINEFLNGIRHVRAFCVERDWLGRFERANRAYKQLYIQDLFWLVVPQSVMEVTGVALLLGAILLGRAAGGPLSISLPVLGLFAVALVRLMPSLSAFGRQRMEMMGTLAEVQQVYQMLTQPLASRHDGARPFTALREGIVFEHVSFTHEGRAALLRDLRLTIRKGTVTAIVGPSGSGKSTLVNLLLGLFEPTQGRILVDSVPLGEYRRATWLQKIGVVTQDPFIYHASAADNILFGRTGYRREDLLQAATIANAHAFLLECPQGYDTIVGERGMKLSGGQQQRVAIARAMLGNPEILIFDEATSHLDAIAEQEVQEAIERVSQDRTVIVIAHRLSTIRQADHIVVLEEGRIVEQGSHESLVREQGRYVHLVGYAESAR